MPGRRPGIPEPATPRTPGARYRAPRLTRHMERSRNGRTAPNRDRDRATAAGARQAARLLHRRARGRATTSPSCTSCCAPRASPSSASPSSTATSPHPEHLPRPGQAGGGQGGGQGRRRQRRRRRRRADARARSATSRRSSGCRSSTARRSILDIFAAHANTAEGKLQVELAQLEYNLARMRGLWTHLERLGGVQRRLRDPRTGRVADRDRPPPRARPHLGAAPPAGARQGHTRGPARRARARAPAAGGARRLHERREVDAAQRADRQRGRRPRPPLPHPGPDDAPAADRRAPLPA